MVLISSCHSHPSLTHYLQPIFQDASGLSVKFFIQKDLPQVIQAELCETITVSRSLLGALFMMNTIGCHNRRLAEGLIRRFLVKDMFSYSRGQLKKSACDSAGPAPIDPTDISCHTVM